MRTRPVGALALLLTGTLAFKNTSPFFLHSTSPLSIPQNTVQLASAAHLSLQVANLLGECPTDAYVIVSQPGVSQEDFTTKNAAPHLQRWLNGTSSSGTGPSSLSVLEVVNSLDPDALSVDIENRCSAAVIMADASTGTIPAADDKPRIVRINFEPLRSHSAKERLDTLAEHDSFIHAVVSSLGSPSFTLLYLTTPPSGAPIRKPPTYSMDPPSYESAMNVELKRNVHARASDSDDDDNDSRSSKDRLSSNLPLFEKYQFLSTGIFVGVTITLILLSILYVGLSAISSLEVSYFAFSKEMGQSAQKKQ